jgi:hypothetical protein
MLKMEELAIERASILQQVRECGSISMARVIRKKQDRMEPGHFIICRYA